MGHNCIDTCKYCKKDFLLPLLSKYVDEENSEYVYDYYCYNGKENLDEVYL